MRKALLFAVSIALLGLTAPETRAQENDVAVLNDACCGKVCFLPDDCFAPTRQSSKRCEATIYNTHTDLPDSLDIPPAGATGCAQVNNVAGPGALACIGGRANEPDVPTGCVCVAGQCQQSGPASSCTGNAVLGCEQADSIVVDDDDPDCPVCPQPPQ